MRTLSIAEQNRRIRRDWPFRSEIVGDDLGLWHGRVYGLSQGYEISIIYVRRHFQAGFEYSHSWFPEVRVISPALTRRREAPDEEIPHLYDEDGDPQLCLFDPAENGWSGAQAIAATTIPWTAEWLRFYEAWHATGVWHGGGRPHRAPHPAPANLPEPHPRLLRRAEALTGMTGSRSPLIAADLREERLCSRLDIRRDIFAQFDLERNAASPIERLAA